MFVGSKQPQVWDGRAVTVTEMVEMVRLPRTRAHGVAPAVEDIAWDLIRRLAVHDRYTAGHSVRVGCYAQLAAEQMELGPQQIREARLGGLLHDIGKLDVPEAILAFPGSLDSTQMAIIREHPMGGARRLLALSGHFPELGSLATLVAEHHERWGGGGYPRNLQGQQIETVAQLISVADSFDAMTTRRAYHVGARSTKSLDEGRKEIARCILTHKTVDCDGRATTLSAQFSPQATSAFLSIPTKELMVVQRVAEALHYSSRQRPVTGTAGQGVG